MPLEKSERDGAAERVDDEVDIGIAPKLAAFHGAPQHAARDRPSPFGKLRQERRLRFGVQVRFGDEADEGGPGDRPCLQARNGRGDLLEVAADVSGVRVAQLALGDIEVQIHAQCRFRRPPPVERRLCHSALCRDALHGQLSVAFDTKDPAGRGDGALPGSPRRACDLRRSARAFVED